MLKHASVFAAVAALLLACGGSTTDDDDQAQPPPPGPGVTGETECSAPTECEALLCLTFKTNPQNKAGICTKQCAADTDCPGGPCVDFSSALGSSAIQHACLKSCATDTDCKNGFACVTTAQGPGCLVRPS